MKLLLTTIAAVLVVGCAKPPPPNISIHEAASDGNIEAVKQHLAAGTDVNAKDDLTGLTPLFDAVSSGKKEVAALLIDKGADVNGKIAMGFTALHNAAGNGRYQIVELLIEKGADVNEKNDFGITPLDMAEVSAGRDEETELDYKKVDDLLRKHGGKAELNGGEPVAEAAKPEPPTAKAPDIPLWKAAKEGNIEAVKQHIAAGTDGATSANNLGRTTLHYAASGGYNKEVVELLIAAGADVIAKYND